MAESCDSSIASTNSSKLKCVLRISLFCDLKFNLTLSCSFFNFRKDSEYLTDDEL